jgi:hypothetical protein
MERKYGRNGRQQHAAFPLTQALATPDLLIAAYASRC